MSFDNTARAILTQTKRCTRRPVESVERLKRGDLLRAVNRRIGLQPGERARTLAVLRVEDIRPAPPLTPEEVELEGYAGKSVALVESILRNMYTGVRPLVRVQFTYVALAAPRLLAVVDRPELRAEWDLRNLPRGDPRRRELRDLQRLGREEILLIPETFAEVCDELQLDPLDLWRDPGTRERSGRRARSLPRIEPQLRLFEER